MKIHIKPVTRENREEVLALKIYRSQKGFIETLEECLGEADETDNWRPVGIYDDEVLVGFSMYGFFDDYLPDGRVWLDRLLIDRRYQGHGYGRAALPVMLDRLYEEYHRDEVYLSVVKENQAAIHLYQEFGFCFTGEKDVHGEDVMLLKR